MIRCPRCGTQNSDGSTYCRNCRESLRIEHIECPQCGHANPKGSAVCARCNTPLSPAHDLDLPEPEDNDELDWLTEITDDTLNAALGLEDDEDLPDWLADPEPTSAKQSGTASRVDDSLDWLRGAYSEQDDTQDAPPIAEEDLPDWMQDFADKTALAESEASDTPNQTSAYEPSWDTLSKAPAEPETDEQEDDDTDWMQLFPASVSSVMDDVDATPDAPEEIRIFPDWLQNAASQKGVTHDDLAAAIPETEHDWKHHDDEIIPDPDTEDGDGDGLPDWLHSDYQVQGTKSETPSLPDWLHSEADTSVDETPSADSDGESSWLTELSGTFSDTIESSPTEEALNESPPDADIEQSWLDDIPSEFASGIQEEQDTDDDDWMSAFSDALTDQDEPGQLDKETGTEPASIGMANRLTPDWLTDLEPAEESGLFGESEPVEANPSSLLSNGALHLFDERDAALDDLPEQAPEEDETSDFDWLSDISDYVEPQIDVESEDAGQALTSQWTTKHVSPDAPATPERQKEPVQPKPSIITPDRQASHGVFETDPEMEIDGLDLQSTDEALPDWLSDLPEAGAVKSTGTPDTLPRPFKSTDEKEAPLHADVPTWMQELRPDSEKPLPKFPALLVSPPEDSDLELADIPEWVIALQPGADAVKQAPTALTERSLRAESEGPLANLGGVIPALASVDMPEGHKVTKPEIPQTIQKQAQLWQKLLEHPRFGQRPVISEVSQKRQGSVWANLATVLLLFAVIITTLIMSNDIWDARVFTEDYTAKTGVYTLATTVENNLGPGDVVVVAVEYGASRVGEMTPIGQYLIEHLASRGVELRFVTSLPEGVMTAQMLQAFIDDQGDVDFIVGQSSGVANYLADAENVDMIAVLTADFEPLQWWLEQDASLPAEQQHQIAVGMSASLRAMAAPYVQQPNVPGWIAGYPEALYYQFTLGKDISGELPRVNALLLSHWLAAALILCGLFYYLIAPRKGTR